MNVMQEKAREIDPSYDTKTKEQKLSTLIGQSLFPQGSFPMIGFTEQMPYLTPAEKPKQLTADTSVKSWLINLNKILQGHNTSSKHAAQFIHIFSNQDIKNFILSLPASVQNSFELLSAALLKAYPDTGIKNFMHSQLINSIKKGPFESTKDYFERFTSTVNAMAPDMSQADRISKFINGFPKKTQEKLMLSYNENDNINVVYARAVAIESTTDNKPGKSSKELERLFKALKGNKDDDDEKDEEEEEEDVVEARKTAKNKKQKIADPNEIIKSAGDAIKASIASSFSAMIPSLTSGLAAFHQPQPQSQQSIYPPYYPPPQQPPINYYPYAYPPNPAVNQPAIAQPAIVPTPTTTTTKRTPTTCTYCGKRGHSANQCFGNANGAGYNPTKAAEIANRANSRATARAAGTGN
jgi:hypothetical protein